MENYYAQEKCRDLWIKIDQLHLGYLELEESPEKIKQREKLEECIAEFLFLASHRGKFVFAETEDVLYRSAAFKKDFSGYKAAPGWNALQMYAANLLTQPWRREYRQIKTYCGFYKHQIEANLLGAETMFEAMGYKHVGSGVLVLDGPICPDKVSNISRDCLVAYVECQILKHIWEEVSPVFNISWLDVLEHRAAYPGNIDHCIRSIKIKYNSKHPLRSTRASPHDNGAQLSSQSSVCNNLMPMLNGQSYAAALAGHNHVSLSAPVVVPTVPYYVSHANGCINNLPYGYATYPGQVPVVKQPLLPSIPTQNGYYYNGAPMMPSTAPVVPYPIPTAQLIELDSRNGYDVIDDGMSSRTRRSRLSSSNGTLENDRGGRNEAVGKNGFASGPEDSRQDVEENWDYVYKNLERQGYSKDLGERGDVLGLTVSDRQRKHNKESKKVKATNLDDALNSLTVSDRPLKMTEALEQMNANKVTEKIPPKERRNSQGSSYENVNPTETVKQPPKSSGKSATLKHATLVSTKVSVKEIPEATVPKITLPPELRKAKVSVQKWECKSCTYLNDLTKDICEMCSKSRNIDTDQRMEVGGPECSTCTLVNPRSAKLCQACGNDLKNSPTYI